jgi:uncharacterized protein (UPF0305 family)
MVRKPKISPNFTVEDIQKLREYNYEKTKHLTFNERMAITDKIARNWMKEIEKIRKEKGITFN